MESSPNCSAGVFNNRPSVADFFHSFRHLNGRFHEVSSIFIPTFRDYRQVWNDLLMSCMRSLKNLSSYAFEFFFVLILIFSRSRLQNVMPMSDRTENAGWRGRERLLILPSWCRRKCFFEAAAAIYTLGSVSERSSDEWWQIYDHIISLKFGIPLDILFYTDWGAVAECAAIVVNRNSQNKTLLLFNEMQIS